MESTHTHKILWAGIGLVLLGAFALIVNGDTSAELTQYSTNRSRRVAARENQNAIGPEYIAWMDGENRYYYSIANRFRFKRPLRWQGRAYIDQTTLMSSGFAPFMRNEATGALKRTPVPLEEIQLFVRSVSDSATAEGIAIDLGGTAIGSTRLGSQDAVRYKYNGNEVITAIYRSKQIDLILKPESASDRMRSTFDFAVNSFQFINSHLREI